MKTAKKPAGKRDLFAEISDGFAALARAREGKQTLRTHKVAFKAAPKVTAEDVVKLREKLELSQALFAACLRTEIGTVQNWEQGRAKPNTQAALLMSLVDRYPDTVERLAKI